MKLNHTDTLALFDLLLEKEPKTSRPGGFTVRLQRLRDLIAETGSAEPTLADIARRVFPGVAENSLRTTLLEFRKAFADEEQPIVVTAPPEALTERELDILHLVCLGRHSWLSP